MAARENQVLQISLVVAALVIMVLAGLTFWSFSSYNDQVAKLDAAQKNAADETTAKTQTDKDRQTLLAFIGAAAADGADAVVTNTKKDLGQYNALLATPIAENQITLKKMVDGLGAIVKSDNDAVTNAKADADKAKKDQATAVAAADEKIKKAEGERDAANATLDQERTAYKKAIDEQKAIQDQLAKDKTDINAAKDKQKADYERQLTDLRGQLASALRELATIKTTLNGYTALTPATSGGKVLWVNEHDNIAYINLGSDDRLQRRISFSVYPPGTTDVAKTPAKGKIEVINITGPHSAETRIVENPLGDPILPGDWVHTEGWQPGHRGHFAIGGFVDLDGTNTDQTNKLRDLITANGGIVDAYLNDKPAKVGAVTVETRYLILGNMEGKGPDGAKRATESAGLMNEAKRLNVEQIGLDKFLDMMGYSPTQAGGAAAKNSGDSDFRPRAPAGPQGGNYYKFGS